MRYAVMATLAALAGAALPSALSAQSLKKAVLYKEAQVYLSPDTSSQVIAEALPGEDVGIVDQSGSRFDHIFLVQSGRAGVSGVSGYVPKGALVGLDEADGPYVLFGAAVELENQAATNGDEKKTATNAARLYFRIYDDFPAHPLAAEALYRSSDILWQLSLRDIPAQRRAESFRDFDQDVEDRLHKVIRQFPDTPWAARAAYDLLDERFTCGDWNEKAECAGKEFDIYQDYVKKYPRSPLAPEAMFKMVFRAAVGWTLYSQEGQHFDAKKAAEFLKDVTAVSGDMRRLYPDADYTSRAILLDYQVEHGTPVDTRAEN